MNQSKSNNSKPNLDPISQEWRIKAQESEEPYGHTSIGTNGVYIISVIKNNKDKIKASIVNSGHVCWRIINMSSGRQVPPIFLKLKVRFYDGKAIWKKRNQRTITLNFSVQPNQPGQRYYVHDELSEEFKSTKTGREIVITKVFKLGENPEEKELRSNFHMLLKKSSPPEAIPRPNLESNLLNSSQSTSKTPSTSPPKRLEPPEPPDTILNPNHIIDTNDSNSYCYIGLRDLLLRFARSYHTAENRSDMLKIAKALPENCSLDRRPVEFSTSLFNIYLEQPLDPYAPTPHLLVNFLKYFSNPGTSFSLTPEELVLAKRVLRGAEDRVGALKARISVGKIITSRDEGIGTGILIPNKRLLTCYHVFNDISKLDDEAFVHFEHHAFASNRKFKLEFIDSSQGNSKLDYIALKIDDCPNITPLKYKNSEINANTFIRTIHCPAGNTAIISSVGTITGVGEAYFSHNLETQKGSSGAPIFDDEWNFLGIHRREEQGNKYAIPNIVFQPLLTIPD